MICNRLISAAALLNILAAATSCGPGDAKFRFVFKELSIQLEAPKSSGDSNEARAMATGCQSIEGLQVDIGLIKDGESKMQSTPRHLHIDPAQGGWLLESSTSLDNTGGVTLSLRLRGSRPQELRFTPGNYRLAVTGFGNCVQGPNPPTKRPLVFYGATRNFTPGQEIAIQANAKFTSTAIEPKYATPGVETNPGFAYLSFSLTPPASGWSPNKLELRSPTSPTLSDDWPKPGTNLGYPSWLGPLPSFGRYLVRVTWVNNTSGNYQTGCLIFDSTTLAVGASITGTALNTCPSAGTPLGQDTGILP